MNDFAIFLLLAISAGISIASAVVMGLLFLRQQRAYSRLKDEYDGLWERVLLHSEAMIKKAHKQALKIIEESELVSAEMKEQFKTAFLKAEERESQEYQVIMKQFQKKITTESLKQFDQFTDKLLEETKKSQAILSKKSHSVQEELDQYVQDRKKELDEKLEKQVFVVIQTILEKVSGQLLSKEQHEELILEALHKAKEEHVF